MSELQDGAKTLFDWATLIWGIVVALLGWITKEGYNLYLKFAERQAQREKIEYERARTDLLSFVERLTKENEALKDQAAQNREYYKELLEMYNHLRAEFNQTRDELDYLKKSNNR